MSEATIEAKRQAGAIRLLLSSATFREAVPPALCGVMIALALAPTIMTPIPAMVDYLNHLARMDILSRAGTADANPFYEAHWRLYPNLAMDLVVPYAAKFIGPIAATRVFLLLSQLLVLTGAMAIERVVKGRIALSPLFGSLFLYSLPFAFGFLNFEFGVGAALWSLAAMLALNARGWAMRLAVHSAICALLYVAHFCAFGIYGAALGFYELSRIQSLRADFTRVLPRFLLLASPAAPLLALYVLRDGAAGQAETIWLFSAKPMAFLHILSGYNLPLSAISMLTLCAGALYLSQLGYLRVARSGVAIGLGFLALFIVIPSKFFGTSFVDVRLLPAAALILPAFMTLRLPSAGWRIAAFGALSAAALANLALVMSIWTSYAPEYRAMIDSFALLDKGARVLVGESGAGEDPPEDLVEYPIYHAPTLAAHFANGFTPTLFTEPGKQPIEARAFIRRLDVGCAGPVPTAYLKSIAAGGPPREAPEYLRNWTHDYDYLYVVGPLKPNPIPARLEELGHGARFVLYRIRKTPSEAQS